MRRWRACATVEQHSPTTQRCGSANARAGRSGKSRQAVQRFPDQCKALVQKQLELVGLLRQAWRCRFAIATGAYERSNLAAWEQETTRALEQLNFDRRLTELQIDENRKELADLTSGSAVPRGRTPS